jgi:biotin operon repressor
MFFKALADANRLKIVGLLAQRPYTGEELSALLDLKASTISHHLTRLAEAGLVSARSESYYNIYQLEEAALQKMRLLFGKEDLAAAAKDIDANAYDRKVIADYSNPDGSLKTIPAQRKKLEVILEHIIRAFEPGRHYSEGEVNDILSRFHADTASLRRELVGYGLMQRERDGANYYRVITV